MAKGNQAKQVEKLTRIAQKIVNREIAKNSEIIAAYSDGSLARGDMVKGSDVDIGFIVRGNKRKIKTIQRELKDGIVFEWGFFPKSYYQNIDEILTDAGFAHDIATAKIWYDPDNFFGKIQETVRKRYKSKNSIKVRTEGQIQVARINLGKYKASLQKNNNLNLIQPLISITRSLLAIPTAILNKPVTNTRAYLYCKRDAKELSLSKYPESVLDILGTKGISCGKVKKLVAIAYKVYDKSNFTQDRIDTFKAHLEIVNYLLDIGEIDASAWPLLFWSMAWIRDLDKEKDKEEIQKLFRISLPIRETFGLVEMEDLKEKQKIIENVINKAEVIVKIKFPE